MSPVRGVGALGVIGLGGAGVGLGGLGERRKAAAEAPGGREQGRGVRAWSLGLERRAFRLSAIRAVPGAFVRTALRVGWRASAGRGGTAVGADQAGRAGALGAATAVPPGFRGLGVARPRGLRCTAGRGDGAQRRRGPRCSGAGELGRGRGGRPRRVGSRRVAIRRLGAVPGISGRAPLRVRWPRGLGCGRLQASPSRAMRAGRRRSSARAAFSDASASSRAPTGAASEGAGGAAGPGFAAFRMGFGRAFRIMSDKAILSDIATPRQAGRIPRHNSVTKRRQRLTMRQVIRADLTLVPDPLADLGDGVPAPPRRSAREPKPELGENPGQQAFPPPAPIPAWARASGRAGEGDPLFAAGAGLALLDALSAPRPARRRGAALPPGAPERRRFRQDPAPQRRRSRAARPALRGRRPAGPAARLLRSGATSPGGRPASTPAGSPPRRRGSTWPWTRTASHPA